MIPKTLLCGYSLVRIAEAGRISIRVRGSSVTAKVLKAKGTAPLRNFRKFRLD
jgi:hypothetical protein